MAAIFLEILDCSTYGFYPWGHILFCNYKALSEAGRAGVKDDKVNTI